MPREASAEHDAFLPKTSPIVFDCRGLLQRVKWDPEWVELNPVD
jgi:hypothetical protein